jgi:glycolate oxidase FAD binding subunit
LTAERPLTVERFAQALAGAAEAGRGVRVLGAGTKRGWGRPLAQPPLELSTTALVELREHNEGDLTAVLEAGVPLAAAQARFAAAGQMLALDPPLGESDGATVGGVVATGDSGPLRHRYGGARDLVVGMTIALSDGTLARSGGKVIKNVAGYDLAKLLAGSYGTLGAILLLSIRLHPLPPRKLTARGGGSDPAALAAGAAALAHARQEIEALDIRLDGDGGAVLARFAGADPGPPAAQAAAELARAGLDAEVLEDDADWDQQRARQRSADGSVVRVSGLQTQLGELLAAARRVGGTVVGRAGLGLSWIRIEDRSPEEQAGAVTELRRALAPSPCVLLDAPDEVRAAVDPWGELDAGPLIGRIRQRFDPAGVLAPTI